MNKSLAVKGRERRQIKMYEKEALIEHLTKTRAKHNMTLGELAKLRTQVDSADHSQLQNIVSHYYADDLSRRQLYRHLRKNELKIEPNVSTISVDKGLKERFNLVKKGGNFKSNNEFVTALLDCYESKI